MAGRDSAPQFRENELLQQLASKDWRERKEAVEDIARLDRQSLARAALEITRQDHTNLGALNAALQLLERVGQPLTADIIAMLTGSDRDLRIYVPTLLAELGGPEVIKALSQAAADPEQPENVRFNSIEALGKLRAADAAPGLAELFDSVSAFLKYGVVVALGHIGLPESSPMLLDLLEDPFLSEAAVTALGNTGDAQAVQAIGVWMDSFPSGASLAVMAAAAIERRHSRLASGAGQAVRQAFWDAVGLDGARRLGLLVRQEDPEYPGEDPFWTDLALILGWAGERWPEEPAVRSALARLLAFPDARSTAELALRQMLLSAPDAVPSELLLSLNSSYPEETYAAAQLLGVCADPVSLPALGEALQSEDETLAALAAEGIGRIDDPQAVALLFSALSDSRAYLRQAAVDALVGAELPWLADHAERMLEQAEPAKRVSALHILARLGAEGAARAAVAGLVDPSAEVRRAALELLPRSDDPDVARLLAQAFDDPDETVRRTVVQTGANLPAEAALPLLERALRDSSHWVRLQSVRGLAHFPGRQILSWLKPCLSDSFPPVRSAVVDLLAQRWHTEDLADREQVRKLLVIAGQDQEPIVRQAALAALESNQ